MKKKLKQFVKKVKKFPFKNVLLVSTIVTFFTIVTIFVIIIAQGKQLTPGGLKDTSIIRLNSIPEDVTAYVNGKKVNQVSHRIENLEPGEITLRLEKEGYSPWEKTISIKGGVVKDIYAQLYPEELNFEQITNTNVDQIAFPNNVDYVFYTVIDSDIENGIWRYKLSKSLISIGKNEPTKITDLDNELLEIMKNNRYSLLVAPDSNYILVNIPDQKLIYIFDSNDPEKKIDLVDQLGYYPDEVYWFRNSDAIAFRSDKFLGEYELSSKQISQVTYNSNNTPIFNIGSNTIYYLRQDNNEVYKYVNKNSEQINLSSYTTDTQSISQIYTIQNSSDVIITQTQNGLTYYNFKKNFVENFAKQGEVVTISNSGNSLIYKVDDKLYSYVLEETQNGKSYDTYKRALSVDTKNLKVIYYSQNNSNLIALISDDNDGNDLWLMDYDGQNPRMLISDKNISGTTSQIANDGTALYLLIEDSASDDSTTKKSNFYKLNLEVK